MADEFLEDGVIYTARHRGQIVDEVKAHARRRVRRASRASCSSTSGRRARRSSSRARCRTTSARRSWASGPSAREACRRSSRCPAARGCASRCRATTRRAGTRSRPTACTRTSRWRRQEGRGVVSYREKDLEGHLAAQAGGGRRRRKPQERRRRRRATRARRRRTSAASEATNVPDDPATGTDEVLKVGWQVLRQSRCGRAAPSPVTASRAARGAGAHAALERVEPGARQRRRRSRPAA